MSRIQLAKDEEALENWPAAMPFHTVVLALLGAAVGAGAAVLLLPALAGSLLGPTPTAFWYLARASGLVAYGLLWASMVLGLSLTSRTARIWPGGPAAFDLHQHTSLMGLAFALFHGLILAGDRYINYSLRQLIVPFASAGYRPLWVGLGQVAFYLLAVVGLSFYARRSIGNRLWRSIHYLSFGVFALALIHGLMSGTDTAAPLASTLYWASGGSLLFLTCYRVLVQATVSSAGASRANVAS
jgi:predicted ferric reductase